MKLNRKGFTLIELLAVIVVLGIILVIAIPKVIDTIENSKKGALESSVKSIIKAAGQYVAKKEVEGQTITEGYITDLDIQNKSDWEGYWVNNNGIITFQYIRNEKEEFIRQNVNATNINTEGISCGEKCIAYSSSDISTLPTDNEQLIEYYLSLNNGVLSWVSNDLDEYYKGPKSFIIPNEVTSIDEYTFCETQLEYVIIPNSVTTIGEQAFSYNNLTSVTIPSSVTTIGEQAFNHNQLTSVTISNSVTTIEFATFANNQLTSITIPNNITIIGNKAFSKNQLTSVTIPNGIASIGDSAFIYNDLTSVTIPSSVTTIKTLAFAGNPLTTIINKSPAKNWATILGGPNTGDVFTCTPNPGKGDASNFISGTCTNGTRTVTITE